MLECKLLGDDDVMTVGSAIGLEGKVGVRGRVISGMTGVRVRLNETI